MFSCYESLYKEPEKDAVKYQTFINKSSREKTIWPILYTSLTYYRLSVYLIAPIDGKAMFLTLILNIH